MRIDELFVSVQGEGMWLGMPAVFVRVAGCNLDCHWCDTPRAKSAAQAEARSVADIVDAVRAHALSHVVITGGEPTIYAEKLPALCAALREHQRIITLETNATRFVACDADLYSLSPKSPASQASAAESWNDAVIRQYLAQRRAWQIKLVVGSRDEAEEALARLKALDIGRTHVFLMPQARTREEHVQCAEWLVPFCCATGCRFGARLQTLLWNNTPGR